MQKTLICLAKLKNMIASDFMKTFKNEHSELINWYRARLAAASELSDISDGHDGSERCIAERKVDNEYKVKVHVLKQKYNFP